MALGQLFDPAEGYGGRQTFARRPSGSVYASVLAAGVAETVTPVAGARYVVFSADGDFYARPDANPIVPTTEIADGSAGELNPAMWDLRGVTTVRVISAGAAIITMAWYSG